MAQTHLYLCSTSAYTVEGAKHVIEVLNTLQMPGATYVYKTGNAWFKVVCREQDTTAIQEKFCDIQRSIEQNASALNLDEEAGDSADFALIEPHASGLYREGAGVQTDDRVSEEPQSPVSVSTRPTRDWAKLADGDQSLTFEKIFPERKILSIQTDTGSTLEWNLTQRIVHISADSEAAVDTAQGRLHTIFEDYTYSPPQSQHILLSETNKAFGVDVRLMGGINPNLLVSTILDSSMISLPDQYRRFYDGAASLRICTTEEGKYYRMSLFGPKPKGVFDQKQKRWKYAPFIGYVYPSRAPDPKVMTKMIAAVPAVQKVDSVDKDVQDWLNRVPENQSLAVVDQAVIAPSPAATDAPSVITSRSSLREVPGEDDPIAIPTWNSRRKRITYDHQSPSIKATQADAAQQQISGLAQMMESNLQLQPPAAVDLLSDDIIPAREPSALPNENLVSLDDDVYANGLPGLSQTITFAMTPLIPVPQIQFEDEKSSREYHAAMKQQAPSRAAKKKAASAQLGSEFTFDTTARDAVMSLLGRMRSKVGKVKLRIEFGRIYLLNLPANCLATNLPNQPSSPWRIEDLVNKLNKMSDKDLFFTKILSIFGNDAEFLTSVKANEGTGLRSVWTPCLLSVIYQFRCTHLQTGENFIVEVDGNVFQWKIRLDTDEYPPVYVHCLQRQWDFRYVLEHNSTDELLSEYGEFAEQLVASLMIPSDTCETAVLLWSQGHGCTATVDQVRVRHNARYRSQDKMTFLDVVQVHETFVEEQTLDGVRRLKAVSKPHAKIPNGQVPVWYEASITSAKAEELFAQNEELHHGQKTAWTQSTFKQEKILQSLNSRAVEMIKHIDGVGVHCDNGFGGQFGAGSSSHVSAIPSTSLSAQSWHDEAHWY